MPARWTTRIGKLAGELVGHLAGAVGRVVVDDDQLAVDAGAVVRGEDRAHQFGQPVAFVVGGHHEGERGRCGDARWQGMGSRSTIIQAVRLAYSPLMSTRLLLALVGALLLVRLPSLVQPMGPDQGLYAYVGERIRHGELAYRDAWDQKPPGIHYVYAALRTLSSRDVVVPAADLAAAALVAALLWVDRLAARRPAGRRPVGGAVPAAVRSEPRALGGVRVRAQAETFIALAVTACARARCSVLEVLGVRRVLEVLVLRVLRCRCLLACRVAAGRGVRAEVQRGALRRSSFWLALRRLTSGLTAARDSGVVARRARRRDRSRRAAGRVLARRRARRSLPGDHRLQPAVLRARPTPAAGT